MLTKKVLLIILTGVIAIAILIAGFMLRNKQQDDYRPVAILGPVELPKAPHWDPHRGTGTLFFVDVYNSVVHRYEPKKKRHTFAKVGERELAFIIPIVNTTNKFIISYGSNLAVITWNGTNETTPVTPIEVANIDPGNYVYRANEGKVSPSGSLFVGTHSPFENGNFSLNKAGLYACSKTLKCKKVLSDVSVSNGMQWSADAKKFYYIDSLAYTVESFSYDKETDALSNRALIFNFTEARVPGVPDGMTIDNEGMIWVTAFNGHQVLRINPETREVLEKIELDALQITSAAFVGSELGDFYITSGAYKLTEQQKKDYPHSGYIFRMSNFRVTGRAGVPFDLDPQYLQ
ncbi:regucalcin-like [Planococcus citri]|uniref:regucalcin-like n=1 Tax=Planococcus citri TaxID=170843 RepID=UPI0031F8000C